MKIKKTLPNATIPTRGSSEAAGYDLYSTNTEPVAINPGHTMAFNTGISMEIPDGYFGAIYARSGLSCKNGLRPANCTGVIDSDYRGDIVVVLHNDSSKIQTVHPNMRIAQIVFQKYEYFNFEQVDNLEDTSRGDGGFGSTGN